MAERMPSTSELIKHLRKVVRNTASRWQAKYPGDIVGIHVGEKTRRGRVVQRVSIVFHVRKKILDLPPEQSLPKTITVRVPNRRKFKVQTDVVAVGDSLLMGICRPGAEVKRVKSHKHGSLGPIVYKGSQPYLITNMHVIGAPFIREGYYNVRISLSQQSSDVAIRVGDESITSAAMTRGVINHFLDVAIARVLDPGCVNNHYEGFGAATGKIVKVAELEQNAGNMDVCISTSQIGRVTNTDAMKVFEYAYPLGSKSMFHLLQISPRIANPGNSGGAVFTRDRRIVGIVLGGDAKFAYAVPIENILSFFNVTTMPS
jgi:S1-C subfamily serine protease